MLVQYGMTPSMSRTGNCYDNAVMESFFSALKREWTHHQSYPTREAARQSLFEYIEVFYNRRRRHSALGYLSPVIAGAAMAFSSVSVVSNALLLKRWKPQTRKEEA